MFGGDWSSASADTKYLICKVISQNHVNEVSSNFMSGSSSWYVTILPSLMSIGIVLVEICMYFVTLSSKTMGLKGQLTITIGAPQIKSSQCQVWCP